MGKKDAAATYISLPSWTFAVESAMTDWATVRVGVNAAYILSGTINGGGDEEPDSSVRGAAPTTVAFGIAFNYGNFTLDMSVDEDLFTNPVAHVTGYNDISASGNATLTYTW